MSSRKQKPCLVVLDVGHGSAAVLHDEGGTVVFDTGKGAHVARHLEAAGVKRVQAMLLSHADADHIGGAATLLMNTSLRIGEVLLNPDSSKDSDVFEQLRYALAEASLRRGARITPALTTSTEIKRSGATIEILHPTEVKALAGVGGKSSAGKRHTSNSMSAAIRVSRSSKSSVLLAADIEFDCVAGWKSDSVKPQASVLVFPHHGGLPGNSSESDAALFAYELVQIVKPSTVVFSNHRTKHDNPRSCVVDAICKAKNGARLLCTQIPDRIKKIVHSDARWKLHRLKNEVVEGDITIKFGSGKPSVRFC